MLIPKDAILGPDLASLHRNDRGWEHVTFKVTISAEEKSQAIRHMN